MTHKIIVFILFFILSLASDSWADSNWGTLIWNQDNWYVDTKPGDVNNDNAVDLSDAVMSLQVLVEVPTSQPVSLQADVNSDGKIGFEEAIYALQVTTGLKPSVGFTAEMLDASPTYYVTYPGDPDGTVQETIVISGTGPYVVTFTGEDFDDSDVSQGTETFIANVTLNPDGTLTATFSGELGEDIITLTAETATYLHVNGVDDSTGTWEDDWFFAPPEGWL